MHYNLNEKQLFKIIIQICRFFQEFSQFFCNRGQCFLHPKVFNCVSQNSIKNLPDASSHISRPGRSRTTNHKNSYHSTHQERDLLSKIGVLSEFRKYNLYGHNLFLFKSPMRTPRPEEDSSQISEYEKVAFELPIETSESDFHSKMNMLRGKGLQGMSRDRTVTARDIENGLGSSRPVAIGGLKQLDFLVQDPKAYFYKRWLWIIFPWSCLYISPSENFSSVIGRFQFDGTDYLSSKIWKLLR